MNNAAEIQRTAVASHRQWLPSRSGTTSISASAVALAVWFSLVVGSLLLSKRPIYLEGLVYYISSPLQRKLQELSSVAILLGAIWDYRSIFNSVGAWSKKISFSMICLCCAWISVSAFFIPSPLSIAYSGLLFLTFAVCACVWAQGEQVIDRLFRLFGFGALLFTVIAFVMFGAPRERWVGGIHPNLFGYVLVIGAIISVVYWRKLGMAIATLLLIAAVSISSRYAILSITLCISLILFINVKKKIGAPAAVAGMLLLIPVAAILIAPIATEVFMLDDPLRGTSSGGSGRTKLNAIFIDEMSDRVFSGYGFRNRGGYLMTHNGYLNFALETGVVVSLVFIGLALFALFKSARMALAAEQKSKVPVTVFLMLFSACLSALFQPQLINFGDSQGVVLIVALTFSLLMTNREQSRAPIRTDGFH